MGIEMRNSLLLFMIIRDLSECASKQISFNIIRAKKKIWNKIKKYNKMALARERMRVRERDRFSSYIKYI